MISFEVTGQVTEVPSLVQALLVYLRFLFVSPSFIFLSPNNVFGVIAASLLAIGLAAWLLPIMRSLTTVLSVLNDVCDLSSLMWSNWIVTLCIGLKVIPKFIP